LQSPSGTGARSISISTLVGPTPGISGRHET
jgi:hypothetical protein